MIPVNLTIKEIKIIMEKLKGTDNYELYSKFWRIVFNNKTETN